MQMVIGTEENMGKVMNSSSNEGAQCISSDGQLCVFTACNRKDGQGVVICISHIDVAENG